MTTRQFYIHSLTRWLLSDGSRWIRRAFVASTVVVSIGLPGVIFHQGKEWLARRTLARATVAVKRASEYMANGHRDQALSVLAQVVPKSGNQPEVLRALALAAEIDFPAEALDCYRKLESQRALSPQEEARMAVLLVRQEDTMDGVLRINRLAHEHSNDEAVQKAREDVERMLSSPSPSNRKAEPLRSIADVEPALQRIIAEAAALPERQAMDQRREALMKALSSPIFTHDLAARIMAVKVLKREQEHDLIAEFTTQDDALADESLFTARIDALMATQQFSAAAQLASDSRAPIPISTRWTIRALVELQSPQPDRQRATQWLQSAMEMAEKDGRIPAMEAAGHVALNHGLHTFAANAFARALVLGGRSSSVIDYLSAARRAGIPASEVCDMVSLRAQSDPLSHDLAQRAAYFRLLTGQHLESIAEQTKAWVISRPNDPFARLLEALAAERLGDTTRALRSLTALPPCQWHKGEIAVIAGLAARSGRSTDAAILAKGMTNDDLFPEEIRFLDSARATVPLTAMRD